MPTAEVRTASRRRPDPLGWFPRVVLALGVTLFVGLAAVMVVGIGVAAIQEESCPARAPQGARAAGYPKWVAPTTFQCVYGGGVESVEFHDTDPLYGAVIVLTPAAAFIGWTWYRLVIRPLRRQRSPA